MLFYLDPEVMSVYKKTLYIYTLCLESADARPEYFMEEEAIKVITQMAPSLQVVSFIIQAER